MTPVTAPDPAWMALLGRPAARVENERVDVCDLVLLGILTGAWGRFTDGVRRSLALARDAPEAVTAADVRAAATAFRYARGLVSAAEFTGLAARARADPRSAVRRARAPAGRGARAAGRRRAGRRRRPRGRPAGRGVLPRSARGARRRRRRIGSPPPTGSATAPPSGRGPSAWRRPSPTRSATTPSGLPTLGADELRRRLQRLAALDDALWQLRGEIASPEAIDHCLAGHRLDWLRLRGEELALAELGAAREARLLVREDGLSLGEVAERAGTVPRERSVYLEDVPEDATAAFAAAAPGEVVGPWLQDARWRVLVLREKVAPSAGDTRAQRAGHRRAAARHPRAPPGGTKRAALCPLRPNRRHCSPISRCSPICPPSCASSSSTPSSSGACSSARRCSSRAIPPTATT